MRQHWIARVQDSINKYKEVQSAYFDGTQIEADKYFRDIKRCKVIARYMQTDVCERYQIVMAANPVVLQAKGFFQVRPETDTADDILNNSPHVKSWGTGDHFD